MPELLFAVAFVLVTSALCSLCEAVLYSVPVSHVESLAQRGRGSGRALRQLRASIDRPIAAILILNTVANTGGAAVAGAMADRVLGTGWLVYFTTGLTLAILVFSEMIPKTAGVAYCKPLASVVARPLQALVWLLTPAIWVSRLLTRPLVKAREEHRVSDEELMTMVRLGTRSGDFKEHESVVIKNILALEARTVRDVMTPRTVVFALLSGDTVGAVRDHDRLLHYSRIPVYTTDFEDIVGLVHRRDVLRAIGNDQFDVKLEGLMTPVDFVLESTGLDEVLTTFLDRRQHLLVAIDEFGGVTGVVTLEDVLEEILGREIVDEFDQVTDLRELARKRREVAVRRQTRPLPGATGRKTPTAAEGDG
jgi:CBS domain containing-hemolysin-like protein